MIKDWLKCSLFNLTLVLSLTACAVKSPSYENVYAEPAKLPAIPANFRQEPAPQWCSPTCTQAVWVIDKASQEHLTALGNADLQ